MLKRPVRSLIASEQTWDLEGLYPTNAAWEADLARVDSLLPALQAYQGRLGESAATLLAGLKQLDSVNELVHQVFWFAYNSGAVDQGDSFLQGRFDRALSASARARAACAFVKPELAALAPSTLATYMEAEPGLAPYRIYLGDILEEQAHTLSAEAEAVIAQMSELGEAPNLIWQSVTAADMQFDPVTDEHGNQVPMSVEVMHRLLHSPDRSVRQAAYESATRAFAGHKRTIAASIAAAQKRDVILARIRRYPNSLAAALAEAHLPESLFYNLIQTAEQGAGELRRYASYRRQALGVERLQLWDLQAPLDPAVDTAITFKDAHALMLKALEPLGPDYLAIIDQALTDRWVDWANNDGKRSGAYSYGCYGYHPVILMTWQDSLADAFTLAHELGHAVHSVLSARSQPYITSGYSHFLAEMASTTNELLLAKHLLATTESRVLRRYVLTRALSAFLSNFWNGSQLAALQLAMHQAAEQGEPLTYESITAMQTDIFSRWYGDTVEVREESMAFHWMRTLHHFRNYYSYQYATGISAAAAFTEAILTEGGPAVQRYLAFLSAGSSAHDIDLLKQAGLDMTTPEPVQQAVAYFGRLVTELERT